MSVEKIIGSTFRMPSKFELIGNKLIQDGERVRVEYAGKELQELVQELGLKKPRVLVGVNGRGNSAVAGITVKDGEKTVLQAAGGVDYTFGEKPLIQLRGRVAEGQGARLNMIADLNKPVDAENMAVSMANKGGKLDVTVNSDMISGSLKADMNSREMRIPQVKNAYDKLMKSVTEMINDNKGVQVVKEKTADSLNKIKHPFRQGKNYEKVETKLEPKEIKKDELKRVARDLQTMRDEAICKAKYAEEIKWQQQLMDEDCEFIAERAKKLGIKFDDPEILKDPEIIKRFSLNP